MVSYNVIISINIEKFQCLTFVMTSFVMIYYDVIISVNIQKCNFSSFYNISYLHIGLHSKIAENCSCFLAKSCLNSINGLTQYVLKAA